MRFLFALRSDFDLCWMPIVLRHWNEDSKNPSYTPPIFRLPRLPAFGIPRPGLEPKSKHGDGIMRQQTRRRWIALAVLGAVTALTGNAVSQQPMPKLQPVPTAPRPVATVHNTIAIGHEEFGKFLMDRGGAEKLEIFVNKKIIELEAAKRGLTVTDLELKAAFKQSVATSSAAGDGKIISEADFIRVVLPKFNKSLYEWMEDIERPRLLLTKMCIKRIEIKEEDLKIQYERLYGEMRQVQIIIWPKGDDVKAIQKVYAAIRNNDAAFDGEARQQANPSLAAALGHIKPITKHGTGEDKKVEEVAFSLKVGQVSEIIGTAQGYIVMKLIKILPTDDKVKFETERPRLQKAAFEARLEEEIPKCFAELRKAADPRLHYTGPSEWKPTGNFLDGVNDLIKGAGATNPVVPTLGAGK